MQTAIAAEAGPEVPTSSGECGEAEPKVPTSSGECGAAALVAVALVAVALVAEVRNPLSRLRAIRDPMTIVADMLLWRETEELLESRGCLSEIPEAVRVWCINTMMGVVRIGATGIMWQSYDADADYFTLCCMRDTHLPMLLRAILDAGRACWEIQYGDTIEYSTHAEWLAAAAKYP